MRINVTSVLVDDQDKALRFYTEVLGFKQKHDVPMGEYRWITVVSPADPDGTEKVLLVGRQRTEAAPRSRASTARVPGEFPGRSARRQRQAG